MSQGLCDGSWTSLVPTGALAPQRALPGTPPGARGPGHLCARPAGLDWMGRTAAWLHVLGGGHHGAESWVTSCGPPCPDPGGRGPFPSSLRSWAIRTCPLVPCPERPHTRPCGQTQVWSCQPTPVPASPAGLPPHWPLPPSPSHLWSVQPGIPERSAHFPTPSGCTCHPHPQPWSPRWPLLRAPGDTGRIPGRGGRGPWVGVCVGVSVAPEVGPDGVLCLAPAGRLLGGEIGRGSGPAAHMERGWGQRLPWQPRRVVPGTRALCAG